MAAAFAAISSAAIAVPNSAFAQTGGAAGRARGADGSASDSAAAEQRAVNAALAEEARFFEERLERERLQYLRKSAWADLGDRCNPGSLRVFPGDTLRAQQDSTQRLVEHLESTIIARGVGGPLDTPEVRSLVGAVVAWEAGLFRPRWDFEAGNTSDVNRVAIAAGLTGETPDPRSNACLPSPLATDTVHFVVPGVEKLQYPSSVKAAAKPHIRTYYGARAQKQLRDDFFTEIGSRNPDGYLSYGLVAPVVVWRDWGIVTVRRPRERGGVELDAGSNGGATYLLHRVDGEWRLLSIVRSWGS